MATAADGVLSFERPAGDEDATAAALVAMREALADEDEVLVLHGAGDAYLFAEPVRAPELRDLLIEVSDRIARRRLPVIAACAAPVLDAGLELALACDLRFARRGVPVGLPAARAGVPSVGAAQRLTRFGGPSLAASALLLGETPACGEDPRLDAVFAIGDDPLAEASVARGRILFGAAGDRGAEDLARRGELDAPRRRAGDRGRPRLPAAGQRRPGRGAGGPREYRPPRFRGA